MIIFCGLPVSVMTLPILALVARANKNGVGRRPTWVVTRSNNRVPNKHTVSLASALRRCRGKDYQGQELPGAAEAAQGLKG